MIKLYPIVNHLTNEIDTPASGSYPVPYLQHFLQPKRKMTTLPRCPTHMRSVRTITCSRSIPATRPPSPATRSRAFSLRNSCWGVDFRPADGQLYGLGSTSRLYRINTSTGAATMVGAGPFRKRWPIFRMELILIPWRIGCGVINYADLNLRVNPTNGTLTARDADINPGSTAISAVAYSNNYSGAASTVLYGIEASTGNLYRLDNPNNGLVTLLQTLTLAPAQTMVRYRGAGHKHMSFSQGPPPNFTASIFRTARSPRSGIFPLM